MNYVKQPFSGVMVVLKQRQELMFALSLQKPNYLMALLCQQPDTQLGPEYLSSPSKLTSHWSELYSFISSLLNSSSVSEATKIWTILYFAAAYQYVFIHQNICASLCHKIIREGKSLLFFKHILRQSVCCAEMATHNPKKIGDTCSE